MDIQDVLKDVTNALSNLSTAEIFLFEDLMAANAYQKKTGKFFEYLSHISYETYSNELEWNS